MYKKVVYGRMFRSLHESFQDVNPNIQELNTNIARYQSVEPNYTIFNNRNDYNFPNTGIQSQAQQSSNVALQRALNSLGSTLVPGTTKGQTEPTDITNLGTVLTGIPDSVGKRVKECRKYEGAAGLVKLMNTQTDPNAVNRCAWRYQKGIGAVPTVAQGAYGNSAGPLDPARPQVDRVGNGVNYYWDLKQAEKQMVTDVCKAATNCLDMAAVPVSAAGEFADLCGFCETSRKIIPIKTENGVVIPRYNDIDSQCAPDKIITVKDAKARCPPTAPGAPQPFYMKCLNANKLDRDCVTLSAMIGGCSPQGTLVKALSSGKNDQDYADLLRNQKSFQNYQALSQTPLSEDVIRNGNATIFSAVMNDFALNRSMYNPDNTKRWVSALDLCYYGGIYEQWDFCPDLKDGDRDYELKCMQKHFLQMGGTSSGTDYPTEENYRRLKANQTWGQYKATVARLKGLTTISDPKRQANALNRFNGLSITYNATNLPRGEASQGVEVFYIDWRRGTFLGRRPYQSAANENIPNFNVGGGEVEKTGLTDGVQMVYIYDLRPDNDMQIAFGAVTDDGWAIAKNQQAFHFKDTSTASSWWYSQAPTWHNTAAFNISAEERQQPNIFMGGWYEDGGGAVFHPFYKIGPTVFDRGGQKGWIELRRGNNPSFPLDTWWKNNCYFTQEIDAPSLQFEPFQPKNYYSPGMHFCDRRLWSTWQLRETNWEKTAQQVGYTFWTGPKGHLLEGKNVMILGTGKSWSTIGNIAGSAIRTWTVVFCIERLGSGYFDLMYMQPAAGGARHWAVQASNYSANAINLTLVQVGYQGPKRANPIIIKRGAWYMAVIRLHPENMSSRAITKMSFFVNELTEFRKGKVLNGTNYEEIAAGNAIHIFNDVAKDRRDTCKLNLGTAGAEKWVHYAWVHGFDELIETSDIEAWKKESTKTWQGRWFE